MREKMYVIDYEKNLSATEFLYFLECPQKFRIYRLLNPIPFQSAFMSGKRSHESYQLRGYKGSKWNGLELHIFFEKFHRLYYSEIANEKPPEEIQTDDIKLLYWIIQQEKYLKEKDESFWFPYATEIQLMTEKQRGVIDCLEHIKNKKGLRIIDYKSKPSVFDKQLLLFYANLIIEYRLENWDEDQIIFDIEEVGCYYYELGIEKIYEIKNSDIQIFQVLLREICEKITNLELHFEKKSCIGCEYYDICKIEQKRR